MCRKSLRSLIHFNADDVVVTGRARSRDVLCMIKFTNERLYCSSVSSFDQANHSFTKSQPRIVISVETLHLCEGGITLHRLAEEEFPEFNNVHLIITLIYLNVQCALSTC